MLEDFMVRIQERRKDFRYYRMSKSGSKWANQRLLSTPRPPLLTLSLEENLEHLGSSLTIFLISFHELVRDKSETSASISLKRERITGVKNNLSKLRKHTVKWGSWVVSHLNLVTFSFREFVLVMLVHLNTEDLALGHVSWGEHHTISRNKKSMRHNMISANAVFRNLPKFISFLVS